MKFIFPRKDIKKQEKGTLALEMYHYMWTKRLFQVSYINDCEPSV